MQEYVLRVIENDGAVFICLPDKAAAFFGKQAVIGISVDRKLRLYHEQNWDQVLERLREMPLKKVKILRPVLLNCEIAAIADDGRIQIPKKLVAYSGMKDYIRLVVDESQQMADIIAVAKSDIE